jgi:hypothetical protein
VLAAAIAANVGLTLDAIVEFYIYEFYDLEKIEMTLRSYKRISPRKSLNLKASKWRMTKRSTR